MIVLKNWKFTQFTLRKLAEFVTTFYQKEEIESNQLKTWGKLSMLYDDFDMSEENKKADYFSCLRRELLAVTDGNQSLRLCRDKLYAEESAAQQTAGTAIYSYQ